MEFSWPAVGAIATIVTVAGGMALLWLRNQLARDFTPLVAHNDLARRVNALEHDLRTAPTHSDITGLTARVAAVEGAVGVVKEGVDGIRDSLHRVERMTDLLLKHQLEKEG